jgi:transcriptional regulator with XRE-family HTH domain
MLDAPNRLVKGGFYSAIKVCDMARIVVMTSLADRVRWILRARGLSERSLGALAGVSKSYVQTLTSGSNRNPTKSSLDKVARASGVRYDWLARGIGPREPYESSESVAPENAKDRAVAAARILGISEDVIQRVVKRDETHAADPGALYWYHQIEAEAWVKR